MSSEVEAFASSVRKMVQENAAHDDWRPGTHVSDRNEPLSSGLTRLGWDDLLDDSELLPFVGAAALELGRAATSPHFLIPILGGSPVVKNLAMYGEVGTRVATPTASGYELALVEASTPVKFIDSLGVHAVESLAPAVPVDDSAARLAAWEASVVGYFAGLTVGALDLALDHARQREIFGRTLAHLSPVQQRLADAATISDALRLSAVQGAHGLPSIAHASSRTWDVMNHCNLVFGAIGYTLEFPMQRYSRRTKALGSFVSGWIDQEIAVAA
ncbi:hypothetical protein C6I20_02355 [Aeromicrobium sp. A1-2]|uniref:acyl-CoA dehydrogenase family protein n=1 Tax=Aeromicrobium sp. A1-2 TaxID=2107713 RepID=UPI000E51401C|nr:acyl-CoA dehydrogenase family protein [Aeromicrobium sp. A1-2]AXT84149.1 hypothetical protein C6I20_02355 [Aeromicrobium sp. A1-2]